MGKAEVSGDVMKPLLRITSPSSACGSVSLRDQAQQIGPVGRPGMVPEALRLLWQRRNAPGSARMALAGAIVLALGHYAFGEWAFHPGLRLWREPAFWGDMPAAAAVPPLNWLAWTVLSLGQVGAARSLIVTFAGVFVGDWVWLLVGHYWVSFGAKLSPDYWLWWTYWLPGSLAVGNMAIARQWWKAVLRPPSSRPEQPSGRRRSTLWAVGSCLATGALLLVLARWVVPRCPVNDFTLEAADQFLVRHEWSSDFEFVLGNAPCHGRRLGAVLEHIELANRQRKHFYKDLDAATFQWFVLSPVVASMPLVELDWRRTLWRAFAPLVRRETEPLRAARIVVRHLRERVGISRDYPYWVGVETIWTQGMTDKVGFERIYVAALRSVGIAARLDSLGQAELLSGGNWQPAPRPLITSWEEQGLSR